MCYIDRLIPPDPYENLYTVVRGAKKFTLFPPTEGWCLEGAVLVLLLEVLVV